MSLVERLKELRRNMQRIIDNRLSKNQYDFEAADIRDLMDEALKELHAANRR